MFLDCTWQLLQQFPSAFEFTEVYLTALWDSVTLGVFRNFMHSASHAQQRHKSLDHCKRAVSVWNWENQFDEATVGLFCNPLYLPGRRSSEGSTCWTIPSHSGSTRRQQTGTAPGSTGARASLTGATWPLRYRIQDLHVWTLCYLRWLSPVQIVDGGSATELIVQHSLLTDIQSLQRDIARLSDGGDETVTSSAVNSQQLVVPPLHRVSSSYPFGAYQLSKHQTVTQSGYCMAASSVRLSVASEDSFSVSELNVSDVSNSEL